MRAPTDVPEANSAGVIRERIDEQLERAVVDQEDRRRYRWVKRLKYNQTRGQDGRGSPGLGQKRPLVRDLVHIRNAL